MNPLQLTSRGHSHFSKHTIQGVLFDLDGVLIDTERLYTRFWIEAGQAMGFPMTLEHALSLRSLNHKDAQNRFTEWFGPTASHKEIRGKRIELMTAYIDEHGVDLKPGIYELLDFLESKQIPFCIATASSIEVTRKHLSRFELNDRFPHIVTAYDVQKGKPEPDIYLKAAEEIGVAPENCIAVEDSFNGLRSAYRAGTAAIMIPDQDEPDAEMLEIIAGTAITLADLISLWG